MEDESEVPPELKVVALPPQVSNLLQMDERIISVMKEGPYDEGVMTLQALCRNVRVDLLDQRSKHVLDKTVYEPLQPDLLVDDEATSDQIKSLSSPMPTSSTISLVLGAGDCM